MMFPGAATTQGESSAPSWPARGLLLALLAACAAASAAGDPAERTVLFDEAAAVELRLSDEEWETVERLRGPTSGPIVVVHRPELEVTNGENRANARSPLDIVLEFEQNLAPVDMSSLDVYAKKVLLPLRRRLTPKLAAHIRDRRLEAEGVEVPNGRYLLEVAIADVEGRVTREEFKLRVR